MKKYFWVIMLMLYIISVSLFFANLYGGKDLSNFSSWQITFIAIQSLVGGAIPLFYPIYRHIKVRRREKLLKTNNNV